MNTSVYPAEELSNEQYHAGPGVSSTVLKELIVRSPAHARALMDGLRRKVSASLNLGTVVHSAVLEPDSFWDEYWLAPDRADYPHALDLVADYKAACKARDIAVPAKASKPEIRAALEAAEADVVFWDDIKACPDGKTEVTPAQVEAAAGIAHSISQCPDAAALLTGGAAELSFYWFDDETGELCRVRPDYYQDVSGIITDLKTCDDARPHAVQRAISNYGYDLSAAMYLDGVAACGKPATGFAWIFAETSPPYAVRVYLASARLLERAHWRYRDGLEQFSMCSISDSWPGYPAETLEIDLPVWAQKDDEVA